MGQKLKVEKFKRQIVFGLARGGIITAAAIARILKAPLDVVIVRKLASPLNPEFGFGAIAPLGTRIIDAETALMLDLHQVEIEKIITEEEQELERRLLAYRGDHEYPNLSGITTVLVDDGIATGVSMKAAVNFVKKLGATDIIVAVPVCTVSAVKELERLQTRVVCPSEPVDFIAVGEFYQSFGQVTDEEVVKAIKDFNK